MTKKIKLERVIEYYKHIAIAIAIIICIIALNFGESKYVITQQADATIVFKQFYYKNEETKEIFLTLAEAIENASQLQTSGEYQTNTIKVINNANEQTAITIPSWENIVLDLNGNTVSLANSINITNNGNLEIKDTAGNGEINQNDLNTSTIINNGILTIKSGIISAENVAIYSSVSGTLTLGEYNLNNLQNEVTSKENPQIIGGEYGIETEGTFYYYDGVVTGRSGSGSAINGTITSMPQNYGLQKTVTRIGNTNNYQETVILVKENYGEYDEQSNELVNYYETLENALKYATDNNTIKVLGDITDTSELNPEVEQTKTIVLDLNNYTLTMQKTIENKGDLTIQGTGILTNATIDTITNVGNLTKIGASSITNTSQTAYNAINNTVTIIDGTTLTGTTTIFDGVITSVSGVAINQTDGIVEIGEKSNAIDSTNPTITGSVNGINVISGYLHFYDGIIYGQSGVGSAINGIISDKPVNSEVITTINGEIESATPKLVYTVQFDSNGGTGTMGDQIIIYGVPTNLNTNTYTKLGYNFDSWNTSADGSGISYENEQSVTDIGDIKLYAQWEQINGVAEINGNYYNTLQAAILAVPTNNNQTVINVLCDVEENVTIAAKKNIVLNLRNHTLTEPSSNTSSAVVENNGVLLIQNGIITKKSNTLHAIINNNPGGILKIAGGEIRALGTEKSQAIYNNGSNAVVEISGSALISSESSNRATITNVNGGSMTITGGTVVSKNYSAVSNVKVAGSQVGGNIIIGTNDSSLNTNSPILQGKEYGINGVASSIKFYDGTLKGRNKAINNQSYIVEKEEGCKLLDGTETIDGASYKTLKLQPNNTVTFNSNGGSVNPSQKYVDTNNEVGNLPVPIKEGNAFEGWYTELNGGIEITENTIITGDITCYAHWSETCLVTFYPNGGTIQETSRQISEGNVIGELPIPIKNGYTFEGWFTQKNGGDEITANTVILDDVTYYAHWSGVSYARVNGIEFATLQDAIDMVQNDGVLTVVELLDDIRENVTVSEGKNIEFDLGNYILRNKLENSVIENYGTIKIINGTITSSAGYAAINNYGSVVMTGGNILATGTRQAIYNKGGNVEISGTAYLSSTNVATNEERGTIHNLDKGNVTITGGTIVAKVVNAIYNKEGIVTIGSNDTTISNSSPVIQGYRTGIKNYGQLNFYDGIIKVPSNKILIDGNITNMPEGYDISTGTETIDGVQYKTAYLDTIITIPTAVTGLTYNRKSQEGVKSRDSVYTITGNKATNAGTYTATVSLKYPSTTTWEDGTITDKTITYTIDTVTLTPELTADDKEYDGTTTATGSITLQGVVTGDTITATATSIEFDSPEVGTGITVTASGITISGSNSQNYVLSVTTATSTADINSE